MVRWFCETFCGEDAREAEARGQDLHAYLEEKAPAGPSGLCVMPHLIGSGNPHFDPRATGAVVGLVQTTTRHQMYKGILEGLACELALISELIEPAVGRFDTIRCTGGGARSRLGLRLRAAMTGKRMEIMRSAEAVCLGAAVLAGVSAGTYAGLEEAVDEVVEVAETVEPEAELAEAYGRQIARYRALYPSLGPVREL